MKKIIIGSFVFAFIFSLGLIVKAEVATVISSTPATLNRVLNVGSKGNDVKVLQKILKDKGFLSSAPTGYFGNLTKEAVKKYQKDGNFMNVTGKADAKTMEMVKGDILISATNFTKEDLQNNALNNTTTLPPSVPGVSAFNGIEQKPEVSAATPPTPQVISTSDTNPENFKVNPIRPQAIVSFPVQAADGSFVSSQVLIDPKDVPISVVQNIDTNVSESTNDTTPRVMYWWGKVNQHIDTATGKWLTDPDGVSGANLDKLAYCQKWFPKTTKVEDYKIEAIGTWMDRGNVQDQSRLRAYYTVKMSTKCVQDSSVVVDNTNDTNNNIINNNTTNSLTVISPNGGETFANGSIQKITWQDNIKSASMMPSYYDINLVPYYAPCTDSHCSMRPYHSPYVVAQKISGYAYSWPIAGVITTGASYMSIPDGQYTIQICAAGTSVCDSSDKYFTISSSSVVQTSDCTSTSLPSITVLSPNGGEKYILEKDIPVSWKSCNVAKTDYFRVALLQYDTNNNIIANVTTHNSSGFSVVQNTGSSVISNLQNTGGWGTYVPGNFYKISIQRCNPGSSTNCTADPKVLDTSDNLFTIYSQPTNQYITLTQPLDQAAWVGGNSYPIGWTNGNGKVSVLACSMIVSGTFSNSQRCVTLVTDQPSSGSYTYKLPYSSSGMLDNIQIKVKDSNYVDIHGININHSSLSGLLGDED